MRKGKEHGLHFGLAAYLMMIPVVGIVVGIVGWRLLQQDIALQRQQIEDRLETSADAAAHALGTVVAAERARLSEFAASDPGQSSPGEEWLDDLPSDSFVVLFEGSRVRTWPPDRLLFRPAAGPRESDPGDVFLEGEELEFRRGDSKAAVAVFTALSESSEPVIRAGALVRLARNLRKSGRASDALDAYDRLLECGDTRVDGLPAELLARQGRLAVWNELDDHDASVAEARALLDRLKRPVWAISRATFEYSWREANEWLARAEGFVPEAPPEPDYANALAVERLWIDRRAGREVVGVRSAPADVGPVMVVGHPTDNDWIGLIAGPEFLLRRIIGEIEPVLQRYRAQVVLLDASGRSVRGSDTVPDPSSPPIARRTAAETGLPWTLHVYSSDLDEDLTLLAGRRRLVAVGLVLMTALVVAGGVLSAQSVRRELRVADLKSSLVAAVSHEFRTPLTLLRQTTEALAEGRVSDPPTRRRYYSRQLRATGRLQRLVEGMLDFARLEAGAFELSIEAFDAGDWIATVTRVFDSEAGGNVAPIRLEAEVSGVHLHADREALTRALWNLLDNAVKYSPEGSLVAVRAREEGSSLLVEVRDRGPGVDPSERDAIFEKFARGRGAVVRAQGTGLGLAMAREIARAHGGDVTVRGRSGGGSIFTLSVPLEDRP